MTAYVQTPVQENSRRQFGVCSSAADDRNGVCLVNACSQFHRDFSLYISTSEEEKSDEVLERLRQSWQFTLLTIARTKPSTVRDAVLRLKVALSLAHWAPGGLWIDQHFAENASADLTHLIKSQDKLEGKELAELSGYSKAAGWLGWFTRTSASSE